MKRILWLAFFLSFSLLVVFFVLQTRETEKVMVGHPHVPDHQHSDVHSHSHSKQIPGKVSSPTTATNKVVQKNHSVQLSHETIQTTAATNKAVQKNHSVQLSHETIQKAFAEAIALKETNFELAQEKIHAVAAALGEGDPSWTEYLHLRGHSLMADGYLDLESGLRFFELERKLFGETEALQRAIEETRLKIKWNEEIPQMKHLTQPIQDFRTWMKENAPAESGIVEKHYLETLKKREMEPINLTEKWLTPQDRADIRYKTFFEALATLPEDSLTLRVFSESDITDAQEMLLAEQAVRQAEPLPLPEPQQTALHTWDLGHSTAEGSASVSDANTYPTTEGAETLSQAAVVSKSLPIPTSGKKDSVQRFGPESGQAQEALQEASHQGTTSPNQ